MKRNLLVWLSIFTLPILACGMTPQAGKADAALSVDVQPTHEISTDVLMVVIAEKGVNVRAFPSDTAPYTHDALESGAVVTVDAVKVVGDLGWCHHQYGWTVCKYLKALEEGQ